MKMRISRSEVHFYIERLIKRGYKKVGTEVTDSYVKITLQHNQKYLIICHTRNGWLSIF